MDKKNTLLLTVIAIATLLVAVVGATFAYFSAQAGEGKNAQINVKTSTVDTLEFSTKPIYIIATQQNFADVSGGDIHENIGSQKAISESTVEYTKGGEWSQDYCYTATVNITSNNFEYAPMGTDFGTDEDGRNSDFTNEHAPELLLKITKKSQTNQDDAITTVYNKALVGNDASDSCSDADEPAKANCVYYESLSNRRRVCTQENSSENPDSIQYAADACKDDQEVEGLDVTVLNNPNAGDGILNKGITKIKIPNTIDGSDYQHKLHAEKETDKVVDTWTAELVFVNYNWNQNYNASKPNSNKKFSATIEFKKETSCSN